MAADRVGSGPGWPAVLLGSRDAVPAVRPDYSILSGLRVGAVGAWDGAKDAAETRFEVRAFTGGPARREQSDTACRCDCAQTTKPGITLGGIKPSRIGKWA